MNKYEKLNKRYSLRLQLLLIAAILFFLSSGLDAGHMFKHGEIPEDYGISYHILPVEMPLIAPDQISPSIMVKIFDKRYRSCDQLPRPIDPYYLYLNYKNIIKDTAMYGKILVRALINKKGLVDECILVQSISDSCLVDTVLYEIKRSTFHPAIRKGKPVDIWIGIPVEYRYRSLQIE